jgi:hypothetical protein
LIPEEEMIGKQCFSSEWQARKREEIGGKGNDTCLRPANRQASLAGLGEAIIFANGTHVELDGTHGLTSGSGALVAQALAGPALKGGELGDISPTAELSALAKLTANWQNVVEDTGLTAGEREGKKIGQQQLI